MMRVGLFFLAAMLLSGKTFKDPLLILAIGDSITQGGKRSQLEYTYRLPLQILLHEHEIAYDFIGSRQNGLDEGVNWPDVAEGIPFDPDHEGYYGNKTQDVCQKVKAAFATYKVAPDIILIHLGTNDQKHGNFINTVDAPLRDLINFIREKNPGAVFLLGHLNFKGSQAANEIREIVNNLAAEMNTSTSPIRTVPHYLNWRENPEDIYTDTYDWAHPNIKGQEKMALKWFLALKSLMK
ncbi:SGNH/GDSL hydrolase family protein [soil metagenome]